MTAVVREEQIGAGGGQQGKCYGQRPKEAIFHEDFHAPNGAVAEGFKRLLPSGRQGT